MEACADLSGSGFYFLWRSMVAHNKEPYSIHYFLWDSLGDRSRIRGSRPDLWIIDACVYVHT